MNLKKAIPEQYDGYLIYGSSNDADFNYITKFQTSDPVTCLISKNGKDILLVSDMEKERAVLESQIEKIETTTEHNLKEKVKKYKDSDKGYAHLIVELLEKNGIKSVAVPRDFPAFFYKIIEENGISIETVKSPYLIVRAKKNENEIKFVQEAVFAAEKAMKDAIDLIKSSKVKDGFLYNFETQKVLTGEDVLKRIDKTLNENNCVGEDTIVSCGKDSAMPHGKTYGPLKANESIVIDIFPKNKKTGYYGDMTRTVLKGKANDDLKKMYEAVKAAQCAAFDILKPGITCKKVHDAVCKTFEDLGYDTYRNGSKVGFIHTTGHGLGLEIHELPSVSDNEHILEEGNVITIEPGLYYPEIGGIRIEDTVVITKEGFKNFNTMEKIFEI